MARRTVLSLVAAILLGGAAPACFDPPPPNDTFMTFGPAATTTAGATTDLEGGSGMLPGTGEVGSSDGGSGPDSTGTPAECGDGVVGGDEACDEGGESPTCNADCTLAECGDGIHNVAAGEQCDDGGESATCDADCTAAECGDSTTNAAAGEACDEGGETAACDADCTAAECGDGVENATAGEQCDDGNAVPGDGCEACLVVVACSSGAAMLGVNPAGDMVVCDDPTDTVCEQDAETLCPAGWGLCTREQHHARNAGFDYPVSNGVVVVGEIFCRNSSGAGHYTLGPYDGVTNLSEDAPLNCGYGSSRPSCESGFGCNETEVSALCCAPSPSCGNGIVDAPEELCDDANAVETDECLNSCAWRVPAAHGVAGGSC